MRHVEELPIRAPLQFPYRNLVCGAFSLSLMGAATHSSVLLLRPDSREQLLRRTTQRNLLFLWEQTDVAFAREHLVADVCEKCPVTRYGGAHHCVCVAAGSDVQLTRLLRKYIAIVVPNGATTATISHSTFCLDQSCLSEICRPKLVVFAVEGMHNSHLHHLSSPDTMKPEASSIAFRTPRMKGRKWRARAYT